MTVLLSRLLLCNMLTICDNYHFFSFGEPCKRGLERQVTCLLSDIFCNLSSVMSDLSDEDGVTKGDADVETDEKLASSHVSSPENIVRRDIQFDSESSMGEVLEEHNILFDSEYSEDEISEEHELIFDSECSNVDENIEKIEIHFEVESDKSLVFDQTSSESSVSTSEPCPIESTLQVQHEKKDEDFSSLPLESIECEVSEQEQIVKVDHHVKMRCSKHCGEKCESYISNMTVEEIENVKSDFYLCNKDFKKKLLAHLMIQQKIGIHKFGICLDNHVFCAQSFSFLTGKSVYSVMKVLKDHKNGVVKYIHGNQKRHLSRATTIFIAWLLTFVSRYGQDAPDECVKVLPAYLFKGLNPLKDHS